MQIPLRTKIYKDTSPVDRAPLVSKAMLKIIGKRILVAAVVSVVVMIIVNEAERVWNSTIHTEKDSTIPKN